MAPSEQPAALATITGVGVTNQHIDVTHARHLYRDASAVGQRSRTGTEHQVATGHEGIGQSVGGEQQNATFFISRDVSTAETGPFATFVTRDLPPVCSNSSITQSKPAFFDRVCMMSCGGVGPQFGQALRSDE